MYELSFSLDRLFFLGGVVLFGVILVILLKIATTLSGGVLDEPVVNTEDDWESIWNGQLVVTMNLD